MALTGTMMASLAKSFCRISGSGGAQEPRRKVSRALAPSGEDLEYSPVHAPLVVDLAVER
jgi:hypothetical protein